MPCHFIKASYTTMLNTQIHEATKHTPYELIFGQPPRSLLVPNVTFKGKINEEELEEPNQEEEDGIIADDHRTAEQDDHHTAAEQDDHHTAEQDDGDTAEQDDHQTAKQDDGHTAAEQDDHHTAEQGDHHIAAEQDDHHTAEQGDHHTAAEQDDHHTATEQHDHYPAEHNDHNTVEHDDSVPQAPKIKKPLATLNKHRNICEKADVLYRRNAERMKHKHLLVHKVKKFAVGESVGLRIPRIDQTATDVHRLPCVIVKMVGKAQDMYCLWCCSGVLDKCYQANELEPFAGSYNIPVNGCEEDAQLSLREAARDHAQWNAFTGNRCNCRSESCDTRRCHCKKKGTSCSSPCHKGTHCKNKQYKEDEKLREPKMKEGT